MNYANWSTAERQSLTSEAGKAKSLMDQVRWEVEVFLEIFETNRIVLLDDHLSQQIPESFAAHAYNRWRRSMREHEVVRLCALWENGSESVASVPKLISSLTKGARKLLAHELSVSHLMTGKTRRPSLADDCSEIDQALAKWQLEDAASGRFVESRLAQVDRAIIRADNLLTSLPLKQLKEARNDFIAHRRTDEDRANRLAKGSVQPNVEADDVASIFDDTFEIVTDLEGIFEVRPTDWEALRRRYRRNGEALWRNARLNVFE